MPFKINVNNSESRHQTGGPMVRSIRLVHDNSQEETDQRAVQRALGPEDASKLAAIMAELAYLDHLEARRESNMACLKRLKEAYEALLASGLTDSSSSLPPDPPSETNDPVEQ